MKGNLIAAGGVLATAVALIGMSGPAGATPGPGYDNGYDHGYNTYDDSNKWDDDKTKDCGLTASDDSLTLRIYSNGVSATRRDADACEVDKTKTHENDHDAWLGHDYGRSHDYGQSRGYWPGNAYWPGQAYWPGSWGNRY
jgi:hypothetical protein